MGRLLKTAVFVCVFLCAANGSAEWRVDIESKAVAAGQTGVTIGVKAYWDYSPLGDLAIPLVVRELDPGSFWTGDLPYDSTDTGGQSVGVTWNWANPGWAIPIQRVAPGVPTGFCDPEGDVGYDGISPDHFVILASGFYEGEPPAPDGRKIVYLTFDVTGSLGQFEFDTACFSSSIYAIIMCEFIVYIPVYCAGIYPDPPVPFNKGVITIAECDCGTLGDCNGDGNINPVDVVYMVNYVYLGIVPPPPDIPSCLGVNGDWNCDNAINPIDLVRLVRYVYLPNQLDPCNPCLFGEPPDLLITTGELFISPNPVEVDQPVSIWAWMYNIGGTTAPSPTIDIYQGDPDAGGTLLASYVAEDVPPGHQSTYHGSHEFSFSAVGPVEIYAVVDYGDGIAEINEDNNTAHETLEVVPAGAAPLILEKNNNGIPPQLPPRR